MKRLLIALLILFTGNMTFAQNDAKTLLDKVSKTMKSYNDIYIDFSYNLINKEAGVEQKNKGHLTLKGDKYNVHFFGTDQIFDGKNTYTIIPENEEVNITPFSEDDDDAFTPSKFLTFYEKGYTYALGETKNIKGKKIQFVKLTPIDSNSEVVSILIGIDTKNNRIYSVTENGKNKTQTILTVKKFKADKGVSDDVFRFDRKKYEDLGYIIND